MTGNQAQPSRHPTRPPWEQAGARRVKTALTLGTQRGGRRRGSARLVPGRGATGCVTIPEPERPRRRRSNRKLPQATGVGMTARPFPGRAVMTPWRRREWPVSGRFKDVQKV